MSTAESASPTSPINPDAKSHDSADRWRRFEDWLTRMGERLNPILVKEARQAMKSRQFSITFTLLLVCGWCWSVLRITFLSPAIYFAPSGSDLLFGYFLILCVPMLVVIPFSAFRSLAAEREDGTFELVSITALSARQIVTGKLGSAVLQMLVYYSAISPCIAFTYLLRGIDIVTILFVLVWTFLLSLALSVVGLMLATATRSRHWQTFLSIVVIFGLGFVTILWMTFIGEMISENHSIPFDKEEVWIAMAVFLTIHISFSVLFIQTAAGRISFASDNKSTRVRITMIVQQLLFTGWMVYLCSYTSDVEVFNAFAIAGGLYWAIVGAIMGGEVSKLSPRVQRQLPRSFMGRMFLTWMFPGSGTAYFFVISNLSALFLMMGLLGLVLHSFPYLSGGNRLFGNWGWGLHAILVWCYVAFYLGAGRILYVFLRRFNRESVLLAFLLQFLLAIGGCAFPWLLQIWISRFQSMDYSPLQFTNWMWTLGEAWGKNASTTDMEATIYFLLPFTVLVIIVNFFQVAGEIEKVHQDAPTRVAEDEQSLHPQEKTLQRKGPWDNEGDEVPSINS